MHDDNRDGGHELAYDWYFAIDEKNIDGLSALIAARASEINDDSVWCSFGGMTALHSAAQASWLPGVLALLPVSDAKKGDDYAESPFFAAITTQAINGASQNDLFEVLRALAPHSNLEQSDEDGRTPLGFAVQENRPELVRFLLSLGANPKTLHYHASILDSILGKTFPQDDDLFEMLLPLCDTQATDRHGSNLLIALLGKHSDDELKLQRWIQLCDQGADPYQPNHESRCAMDVLKDQSDFHPAILAAMLQREEQALFKASALPRDSSDPALSMLRSRL